MKFLQIRDRISYVQRFIIFGIIYLISNLINGIDPEASLGIIQIFGGFLMGPLLLITFYLLLLIPLAVLSVFSGNTKLKGLHKTNLNLSTVIFDLSAVYLFASIFIPGLFYE
jgi:hypothetical protein